jgi:hypothetical protein
VRVSLIKKSGKREREFWQKKWNSPLTLFKSGALLRKAEKLLGNFDDFSLSPLGSLIFLEGKTIFPPTPRRGERGKTKKSSGLKKVVKGSGKKLVMCTGS